MLWQPDWVFGTKNERVTSIAAHACKFPVYTMVYMHTTFIVPKTLGIQWLKLSFLIFYDLTFNLKYTAVLWNCGRKWNTYEFNFCCCFLLFVFAKLLGCWVLYTACHFENISAGKSKSACSLRRHTALLCLPNKVLNTHCLLFRACIGLQ